MLGLNDLVSVHALDIGEIEITLQNLEYQLTKTIKKTVAEFSSIDELFASTAGKVQLTAYITPSTLPANWKDAPQQIQKAVDELKKRSGGKLEYTVVEPSTDADREALFKHYGLRPFQDGVGGPTFYCNLMFQVGDRLVRAVPPREPLRRHHEGRADRWPQARRAWVHQDRRPLATARGGTAVATGGPPAADPSAISSRSSPAITRSARFSSRTRFRPAWRRSCSRARRASIRPPSRTSTSS